MRWGDMLVDTTLCMTSVPAMLVLLAKAKSMLWLQIRQLRMLKRPLSIDNHVCTDGKLICQLSDWSTACSWIRIASAVLESVEISCEVFA